LNHDSTVVGWGSNSFGQQNVPHLTNVCGDFGRSTFIWRSKKMGAAWSVGQPVDWSPLTTNAIAIAAGWDHALALQQTEQ